MPSSSSSHPHAVARRAARTLGTTPPFEVRKSRIQGRGVFATRRIRKGQRITQYLGEPITHEEADRRYDDRNGRHHTFLFVLDDETVLDARRRGSDAKYINHSCDPNCETVIDDGEIWIEAIKPIAPETELVYDYRFEWDEAYEPADVRYYACRCGSAKCRGTILRVPVRCTFTHTRYGKAGWVFLLIPVDSWCCDSATGRILVCPLITG